MPENQAPGKRRFAVIDLEASSSKPRNRIIEIAAIILEDNGNAVSLIDSYSTLVNPEVEVPNDILELTGITLEELKTAPKFFEVAEDLELLTRDCVVVAHNVEFDINLLKEEYEKLGTEYLRKTKCTHSLAKEHYSELAAYDLKSLCELLDIELNFNHRAMDDAVACAELFQKTYIKSLDSSREEGPSLTKIHKIHPELDLNFLSKLTPTPGLVHFNKEGVTVFIERFENLSVDVPRYLLRFAERYETDIEEVQILSLKDSLMAMRTKEERIDKLQPHYNVEERKDSWGVFLNENPFSLRAFPLNKGKGDLLFISNNKDDSIHWINLQLSDVEKQEFAYIDQQDKRLISRLKKEREKQIRAKVKPFAQYPHDYFVVMGPGRDDDELSCHFFTGGKLTGHAFLSGQAVFTLDKAPASVKPIKETELLKHYFLREFQDWKTRTRKDHSIKVLKSNKKSSTSDQDTNGNTMSSSAPNRHKKKAKTNRNFKGKKPNNRRRNTPNKNQSKPTPQ
ncbi:MAG: 3'-5' exonuclease [Bacteriovoracaceae bacterium]|nr:3'-5' exonuclease [Bacteriovoracaceae bacterium]